MKILVYPHDLRMGGSQLNAIQIASGVRNAGHEVIVYGQPGPLVDTIQSCGLEFVAAPRPRRRPSPAVVGHLHRLVAARGIDVVHGYEWPPALEGLLATKRTSAHAMATVMSMAVAPFLPHSLPLAVGTEQIAASERLRGRRDVVTIEPPVDLSQDGMGFDLDLSAFRRAFALDPSALTITVVSRLARDLKLEGLVTAMEVVGAMHCQFPVRLVVVGDGPARHDVRAQAEKVNQKVGAAAVVLTGELADPRPAYAVADVALGMGGSALRAMAFGKPLIVQGEGGFWQLLTPDTLSRFQWTGWYGHGCDGVGGGDALRAPLTSLLESRTLREQLGRFSRRTVEQHYSLADAAATQVAMYERITRQPHRGATLTAEMHAGTRFGKYQVGRFAARVVRSRATEDFNAQPLARSVEPAALTSLTQPGDALLYFAGVPWDAVPGTDRRLVTAIAGHRPVVWVDPPTPLPAHLRDAERPARLTPLGPNLLRVHPVSPPGVTRVATRALAHHLTARQAARGASAWGHAVGAVVVSSPRQPLPKSWPAVPRCYFETDDFVAGAELFGMSSSWVQRTRQLNVRRSTMVAAVSSELAAHLGGSERPWMVLPNGCDIDRYSRVGIDVPVAHDVQIAAPRAGVVGQFNDRLDLQALLNVADSGVSLLLVGPRFAMSRENDQRFEELLSRANVQWVDRRPSVQMPEYLAALKVGLTPYVDSEFNRASFPLKTLEYLAAGLAVVSTELPATRELDTDLIDTASGPDDFAKATVRIIEGLEPGELAARRRRFASQHSWSARAKSLVAALERGEGLVTSTRAGDVD